MPSWRKPRHVELLAAILFLLATLPGPLRAEHGRAHDDEQFIQGRCVEYEPATRRVIILKDLVSNLRYPEYRQLPPAEFQLPEDMGPEPKAGGRVKLDLGKQRIILYDQASKDFRAVTYNLARQFSNIGRRDPLVWDQAQRQPRHFPVVDRSRGTVTIYSRRQDTLIEFKPPTEDLDLPESAWDSGDEVRIVYRSDGQVLKFDNLTRQGK